MSTNVDLNANIVERMVLHLIPDAEVEASGSDCDFTVTVVSPSFEGMLPVKRQQKVLAGFSDLLAKGELHALTVKAYTLDEWNKRMNQGAGLVQISGLS